MHGMIFGCETGGNHPIHRNTNTTYYSVMVIWRGELQKMNVSGRLYRSVEEGDNVRVCVSESIFGQELWRVHR